MGNADTKELLDCALTVNVTATDVEAIKQATNHLPLSRSALVREALRLGLHQLLKDPTALFRRPKLYAAAMTPQDK